MAYDVKELLALPDEEKIQLANTLLDSVHAGDVDELDADTIAFLEERLALHNANPEDGIPWEEVKAKLKEKYGF
jgi:putative addiction module component (TIGR02574 family)